jgi:hypothetical protein
MARAGIKPKPRKAKATDKRQSERFSATARKLGANQRMEEFEQAFRKIVPLHHLLRRIPASSVINERT